MPTSLVHCGCRLQTPRLIIAVGVCKAGRTPDVRGVQIPHIDPACAPSGAPPGCLAAGDVHDYLA